MKTGNTRPNPKDPDYEEWPQWSPVMKTGNTCSSGLQRLSRRLASMEPGHEDREYTAGQALTLPGLAPQWSPVMKTGNTQAERLGAGVGGVPQWSPVMTTGNTRRVLPGNL